MNYLVVAIGIGVVLGNFVERSHLFEPGIRTYKLWLEIGIVLLGGQLVLSQFTEVGRIVVVLAAGTILIALVFTEYVGKHLGMNRRLRSLLGAGIGVCGVSAVVAVAGSVRARQEEIAYVVGTILALDAITIVLYPVVGSVLGLDSVSYGIWAGLTMFSTGPVAAAGFAHSADAGTWAVLTKLVRNSLLGFVVIYFSIRFSQTSANELTGMVESVWSSLPKFVIGFACLSIIASMGVFSSSELESLEHASQWAFLFAFIGLGYTLKIEDIRRTGLAPILVTSAIFAAISITVLVIVLLVR